MTDNATQASTGRGGMNVWLWIGVAIALSVAAAGLSGAFDNLGQALSETLAGMDGTATH